MVATAYSPSWLSINDQRQADDWSARMPEEAPLAEIETLIEDMPTRGHARVRGRLRRKALIEGRAPARRKHVYRSPREFIAPHAAP